MAGERVLIVEDQVTLEGKPLARLLTAHGFTVVGIAQDAASALESARKNKPTLILMDIMLPGDDEGGVAAARRIRGEMDVEIVYVTGADTSGPLMRRVSETKPFGFITWLSWNDRQVVAMLELFFESSATGRRVVFVCYAHEDERYMGELCDYLKSIKSLGVDPWVDQVIRFGEDWREKIGAAVDRADAAVLLVSIDFMNSRFIQEFELPRLLEARSTKGLEVHIVYISSLSRKLLEQSEFSRFKGINAPDDPLDNWDKPKRRRLAWALLCDHLAS